MKLGSDTLLIEAPGFDMGVAQLLTAIAPALKPTASPRFRRIWRRRAIDSFFDKV
jgi:hypothetical protein